MRHPWKSLRSPRLTKSVLGTLAAVLILVGCPDPAPVDGGAPDAGVDAGVDSGPPPVDAGPPPTCTSGVAGDAAPTFAGLESAVVDGPSAVILSWPPAMDDSTPADSIRYHVYQASSGELDFASPVVSIRSLSTRIEGLMVGTTYRFVVRAEDSAGQIECNEVELSATPAPISGCMDYATDIQPIFDSHCTGCHGGTGAHRAFRLTSHADLFAGGESGGAVVPCRPEFSLLHLKVSSETPPQGARMPWRRVPLLDTQIERIRLWIEQGAGESCPSSSVCSDGAAPTFSGITSATLTGNDAELCWDAAVDDTTPPGELTYDVFPAYASGTHDLTGWARSSSAAGATCITMTGLAPGQQYCWVVRSRDAAGNRDGNTVERCVTVPDAACIDYATVVQPLFDRECVHCHGPPVPVNDLNLESYTGAMTGGLTGPVAVACDVASSVLTQKISETPPFGDRMPADGPPHLGADEILMLEQWVTEGARASCSDPDPCSSP